MGGLRDSFIRCSTGETAGCDEFFEEIAPNLRRIASRIAAQYGANCDSEDLIQDICLKLLSTKEHLAEKLPPSEEGTRAYFYVVAANAARDWYRRRGHVSSFVPLDRISEIRELSSSGSSFEKDQLMRQIVAVLPEDTSQRTVFLLYYRQGLTAREIALIPALGLTTKGVESMLLRLSRQVRERFVRGEGNTGGSASSR